MHAPLMLTPNVGLPSSRYIRLEMFLLIDRAVDELAPWRPARHKIGKRYVAEYLKHFPILEPADDFDDRNALICM